MKKLAAELCVPPCDSYSSAYYDVLIECDNKSTPKINDKIYLFDCLSGGDICAHCHSHKTYGFIKQIFPYRDYYRVVKMINGKYDCNLEANKK